MYVHVSTVHAKKMSTALPFYYPSATLLPYYSTLPYYPATLLPYPATLLPFCATLLPFPATLLHVQYSSCGTYALEALALDTRAHVCEYSISATPSHLCAMVQGCCFVAGRPRRMPLVSIETRTRRATWSRSMSPRVVRFEYSSCRIRVLELSSFSTRVFEF